MTSPSAGKRSRRTQDIGRPPVRERKLTPPRIRRRRLLFWLSLVPAFIVFLFGVHFARINAVFDRGEGEYAAGEYYDAYQEFRDMRSPNVVDPWKAHFNSGTAAYRADMLFSAQTALERALEIAPDEHRCDVQTNLSFVYEDYGDLFEASAQEEYAWAVAQAEAEAARQNGEPYDASLFELDYNDDEIPAARRFDDAAWDQRIAADYYSLAASAVNDPACQTPPESDASQEEQEQAEQEQREAEQDRLEEQALDADQQRQEIERAAAGDDPQEAEPQPEGETEEERAAREEAERQEEIEQRNQDAQEEAEGGGGEDDGDGDGGDSDTDGTDPGAPPLSNW